MGYVLPVATKLLISIVALILVLAIFSTTACASQPQGPVENLGASAATAVAPGQPPGPTAAPTPTTQNSAMESHFELR